MRMARYQPQAAICRKESTSRSQAITQFQLGTVGDANLDPATYGLFSGARLSGRRHLGVTLGRSFGILRVAQNESTFKTT